MADISQIKTPDNTVYDIKDSAARSAIADLTNENKEAKHWHSYLQNSLGDSDGDGIGARVALLLANETEGTYILAPRTAASTNRFKVYLGGNQSRFYGCYTDFVVATNTVEAGTNIVAEGTIQANTGNIWAKATDAVIQSENQVYAKKKLTCDGTLAVNKAATFDSSVAIGGATSIRGITTVSARVQPLASVDVVNLGYNDVAGHRWSNIYSKTSVNVSSDRRVKTEIQEIDDRYIELFDLVQPCSYKFIDGTSGRVHTGFISQDVEDAMEKVGLEATELAFFCKDLLFKEEEDENGELIQVPDLDENGVQKYYYSLRYEEYIAIMTEKIKRLEEKLNKYSTLEARLSNLEEKVLL